MWSQLKALASFFDDGFTDLLICYLGVSTGSQGALLRLDTNGSILQT
jgi:hypothetical protein